MSPNDMLQIAYVTVGKEAYLLELPESLSGLVPQDYELRSSKKVSVVLLFEDAFDQLRNKHSTFIILFFFNLANHVSSLHHN